MQPNNPDDKIYEEWGVTPPSREGHGTEVDLAYNMLRPAVHGRWKQQGNILTCYNCPNPHSTEPIPTDYILKGTDEKGLPILEKLGIH